MKKTFVLTLAFTIALAASGFAQKFGYCNSAALLSELPEVKAADSQLKDFQTMLTKKGQEMVKNLQDQGAELEKKKEQGTISPKDYETQSANLKADEDNIGKYEQEVYQKLSERRENLYKPILDKVNTAMKNVATEQNFLIVFDSNSQIIVYADESLDVTKLVRAKLGLPPSDGK